MGKSRRFTPEFKAKIALAVLQGDKPLAVLCREHLLSDTVVVRWCQQLLEWAAALFAERTSDERSPQKCDELEWIHRSNSNGPGRASAVPVL